MSLCVEISLQVYFEDTKLADLRFRVTSINAKFPFLMLILLLVSVSFAQTPKYP
jgi:hypothetical protein